MRIPLRWPLLFGVAIAASPVMCQAQVASPSGTRSSPSAIDQRDPAPSIAQAATSSEERMLAIWHYLGANRYDAAKPVADELLKSDPNNSVALVANAAFNWNSHTDEESALRGARRALRSIDALQRPATMQQDDFSQMVRAVRALANHVVGDIYRMRGDYVTARRFLKESVALEPSNGDFAFSAALAYLDGKSPDASTGYWLLARSVGLARNTPIANDVANFARQKYERDGGSSQQWDKFVASAAAAPTPGAVPETPVIAAAAQPPAIASPASRKQDEPVMVANARTIPDIRNRQPTDVPPLPPLKETPQLEPAPERRPLKVFRQGAPMSLGIVIQASIASKENRNSVVYTLSDMVRGLRDTDEAFVESYGDKITFGQDLTWNYDLLEKAMDQISPTAGRSLLDAVGFAAQHLRRIAKNENRVLFVISDGGENGKQEYSDNIVSDIRNSGARIVCVGIGVGEESARVRLRELASLTGGQAVFIDGPAEFRSAAHQIASSFGLHFQE